MPERRIVSRLLSSTGVTALVGSRVRPLRLKTAEALPAVVYNVIDKTVENVSTGTDPSGAMRIQLDCWATSYPSAKALAYQVRKSLSGWGETSTGTHVSRCHLDSERDMPSDRDDGGDDGYHAVQLDFLCDTFTT